MILNSSVHTRLAQILTPVTGPSAPCSSSGTIESHQHFLAGFRQNNNNFWLVAAAPSVCDSIARARDVIQALEDSKNRLVQSSDASKPDEQSMSIRCCSAVPVKFFCPCRRRPSKIDALETRNFPALKRRDEMSACVADLGGMM